jgi:hypothetical protein
MPISNSDHFTTARVILLTRTQPLHRTEDSTIFLPTQESGKYEKCVFSRLYSSVTLYDSGLVASSKALFQKCAKTMRELVSSNKIF